jgi:hypothetical protein
MYKNKLFTKVDKKYPGLQRLLDAGYGAAYVYLSFKIDANVEVEYPDLVEYLKDNNPDPELVAGPPSRLYQALADLFLLVSKMEYFLEETDFDELDYSIYPPPETESD